MPVLHHSAPFWPDRKLPFWASAALSWMEGTGEGGHLTQTRWVRSGAKVKEDLLTGGPWPWRQSSVCLNLWAPFCPQRGKRSTPLTQLLRGHLCVFYKPVPLWKTCLFFWQVNLLCSHVFLSGRPQPPTQATCSVFCVSSALYYPIFHTRFILDWFMIFLFIKRVWSWRMWRM